MIRSKGQNAVEYMMTYGWAILVVMVVGIVVWQMGFLDLTKNVSPDKRGFSQVVPIDWVLSQEGTLSIVVQNNAGSIVDVGGAGEGTSANIMVGGGTACAISSGTPVEDFRPASTIKIEFDCGAAGRKVGDYYRVNVSIQYTNPTSGLSHLSNGIVWGPVG